MAAVTSNQLVTRQDGCRIKAPVAASTTIYGGTLVFTNATGYADDDTAGGLNEFAGVAIDQKDNSAGSDGDINAELWIDGVIELTGTGFTQASKGKAAYATSNYDVTETETEAGVVIGVIEEYISTTKVGVRIAPASGAGPQVQTITESIAFGDMTDGGATTGYKDWTTQLPAGAIPLGVRYVVATGFTGDTSSAVQTGVAGDVDRFSAVTDQSVLAAATVGHGVPTDSCDGMGAAQTIRTTITGAADFTSISAGALVATLRYII